MSIHLGKLTFALACAGLAGLATIPRVSAAPSASAASTSAASTSAAPSAGAAPSAIVLAGDGQHRGPPPEAIEACSDLEEGDACEVETPDGKTLEGTCTATREGQIACRPKNPPPHREPPQAAFEACADASSGDACVMSIEGHGVDGTCEEAPSGGLACRPEGPPPKGTAS